ncbi:MAG TPA: methyltransferase domain-containing protein [Candidatus Acidoferrales bacterium]|nr:methyltransferase domain-containing protein [Candidatus Acidoferrales bacterium]
MQFSDADAANGPALIEYLDDATRNSGERKRATYAAQRLSPGMRVLDAGCGTGDDVRAIAQIVGAEGRVTGIDSSRTMIDEAQARGVPPNAAFVLADAGSLPFADGAFDAVRAERLFQHMARPQSAANELRRVLAAGGTALLLDQDWESLAVAGAGRDVTRRIVRAFVDHLANGWAARESRGMLLRAGFASATSVPAISQPPLPLAFETILKPAMEAAMRDGSVDSHAAQTWLQSLLEADLRGEFFCTVLVVITVGTAPQGA